MPFARISLMQGKSDDYLKAVSDSLYQAMIETFNVPQNDLFQVIHQHRPNEFIFDRHYLGGPRSDDFISTSSRDEWSFSNGGMQMLEVA